MLLSVDVGLGHFGLSVWDKGKIIYVETLITKNSDKKRKIRVADDNFRRGTELAVALREIINKYSIKAIIGELPHGGAQSARALQHMNYSSGIICAVAGVLNLPTEWCTPNEVKKAVTGKNGASKEEIMNTIREKYSYFNFPKTKSKFEHIADSVGAYIALSDSVCVKVFG